MAKQPVSVKGVNAGKNKLDLPNNQELQEMTKEELNTIQEQVKSLKMVADANKSRGLTPAGGNMREIRRITARILTIKQRKGW